MRGFAAVGKFYFTRRTFYFIVGVFYVALDTLSASFNLPRVNSNLFTASWNFVSRWNWWILRDKIEL